MQKKLVIMAMTLGLLLLAGYSAYSQCPGDTVGICDTLHVEVENGRIQPNTSVVRHVWGYHDEPLLGISIPLLFKTNQMDVTLDSVRFHADVSAAGIKDSIKDTVGDGSIGKITILLIWFTGQLNPGVDTFATLYFTTGASWNPAIPNPIDTFRLASGQGLSFTDSAAKDIVPRYLPPGNLDVGDDDGKGSLGIPKAFNLSQNYPNPFNAVTVISFAMPKAGHVNLEVYNILGQKVKDLVDEKVTAGYKRVVWDGKDNTGRTVASGVYFYKLRTEGFVEVMKMTLLK